MLEAAYQRLLKGPQEKYKEDLEGILTSVTRKEEAAGGEASLQVTGKKERGHTKLIILARSQIRSEKLIQKNQETSVQPAFRRIVAVSNLTHPEIKFDCNMRFSELAK